MQPERINESMIMVTSQNKLNRFIKAQEQDYQRVLAELKAGEKKTHWMWYVFPQFEGLGRSDMAQFYSIKSEAEARQYLGDPILGKRLLECTEIMLNLHGKSISEILGHPDDLKFRSSMTLFAFVAGKDSLFERAINRYFDGQHDENTLERLEFS